jgi:hypothetical protein
MASDPHNKMSSQPDNVVSLSRHEFVATIEKKLTAARRLFSLHDYSACEEIVMEVLAADPRNPRARALLELASVKLSKKKLYRKMVDPQSAPSPAIGASTADSLAPPVQHPAPVVPGTSFDPSPESSSAVETEAHIRKPSRVDSQRLPLVRTEGPADTMRERTISALVELLKQKDRTLEDWRGQRNAATSRPETETASGLSSERKFEDPPSEAVPKVGANPTPPHSPSKPSVSGKSEFVSGPSANLLQSDEPQGKPRSRMETMQAPAISDRATPDLAADPPNRAASKTNIEISADTTSPVHSVPLTPKVVHLPDVRLFEQVEKPHRVESMEEGEKDTLASKDQVEEKLEQRSEEIRNSEIRTVSVAQIKKHLYQEEYELCTRELEHIRRLFPQNPEIQGFVENTSKRLVELQRIKAFEHQAKELMASAVAFYQEGKLEEALIAAHEVLRVNPNYLQAREFVSFVARRHTREQKKEYAIEKVRYCKACGTTADAVSQFCFRCGKRLT